VHEEVRDTQFGFKAQSASRKPTISAFVAPVS
jgi:hypothetical protein